MKCLRIKKQKEFTKILRVGKRAHAESLTIVWTPSQEIRYAVCVGKKYGKSVVRNRIKRLLREAFRSNAECFAIPCSILLIPRAAKEYSYAAFARDLGRLLKKEKLTAPRPSQDDAGKRGVCHDLPQKEDI